MNFLHGGDHIVAMFDRIVGSHCLKKVVVERPGSRVQIVDDIRMNAGIGIEIDGIGQLLIAAT